MSISNIIVNVVLIKYGDSAVAAMGIAMKANMLVVMLQIGPVRAFNRLSATATALKTIRE